MSYMRVIPRDLFNDANLLKCIGKLVLAIHDGVINFLEVDLESTYANFEIYQDESDGSTYVGNVKFKLVDLGVHLHFYKPLNSRQEWPLELRLYDESYAVFDSEGVVVLDVEELRDAVEKFKNSRQHL